MARHAIEDLHTPHGLIPKGSTILVNMQAVHHNPAYWPNPMEFNPQRFLGKQQQDIQPFTFLPFIAGPRNCLGQYLSLLESKIVLGMLTQRYQFMLPPGEVLETKSWSKHDPRHRFMVPVCPQKELQVLVKKKKQC